MTEDIVYASVFIPIDLSRSPICRGTEEDLALIELSDGEWTRGPLQNLTELGTPSEPFMRKLINEVPKSLLGLTGKHAAQRFHKVLPYIMEIRSVKLYAIEFYLNHVGTSVFVLHLTTNKKRTNWETIEDMSRLNSLSLSEWTAHLFRRLPSELSSLYPKNMNYGIVLALSGKGIDEIDYASNLVENKMDITRESIWAFRSKFIFLGILLTIQKTELHLLRTNWPVFNKASAEEVGISRNKLFNFLNRYWWIKISDNSSLDTVYTDWHEVNRTQRQIDQFTSEIGLYWADLESQTSQENSRKINRITIWGAFLAVASVIPTWIALFL